jgi:hypothetical protein
VYLDREGGSDWRSVMKLLDQGASPDYESAQGVTSLMVAALEDPDSINFRYQLNDNGR